MMYPLHKLLVAARCKIGFFNKMCNAKISQNSGLCFPSDDTFNIKHRLLCKLCVDI